MTEAIKYPRTYHFPWSPGTQSDDRFLWDYSNFYGKEVVVTEKMDGENTSLYRDFIHTRALSFTKHPSRTFMSALHDRVRHDIPEGWRVCGENIAAVHSIKYDDLESFFMVFSIWNEKNEALSWDDTVEWCNLLDLHHVPVLWRGVWNEDKIKEISDNLDTTKQEGFVCRLASSFPYKDFAISAAKWVRAKHVQTDEHWLTKPVEFNGFSERK